MFLCTCYCIASPVLGCQSILCVTFEVQVDFCFFYDLKFSDYEDRMFLYFSKWSALATFFQKGVD